MYRKCAAHPATSHSFGKPAEGIALLELQVASNTRGRRRVVEQTEAKRFSVEVYAAGSAEQLQALRADLQRGPRHALVEELDEVEADVPAAGNSGFSIEED